MSVLIKDMEKPKSCYAVIDGESEYCPFVNTDDDCVLLLKKGRCEGTWADQYSKCPLIETAEPCEVAVSAMAVEEMLKNLLPERGIWEIEGDDAKTAICETIHDALEGLWKMPFVKPDSNKSSVTQNALDTISRQAAIDATRNATFSFTIKSDTDFANYRKEIQEIFNNVLDAQEKALNELPSAQQEIIRCKDCKFAINADTDMMCGNPKSWVVATENDFGCILAERREQ